MALVAAGAPSITVRVENEAGLSTQQTFVVTVRAVNDVPTITAIPNQAMAEDGPPLVLPFVVSDVESSAGALTVSSSSTNATLSRVTVRVDDVPGLEGGVDARHVDEQRRHRRRAYDALGCVGYGAHAEKATAGRGSGMVFRRASRLMRAPNRNWSIARSARMSSSTNLGPRSARCILARRRYGAAATIRLA